jgi:acetyltransferase-like isoleucine patch superfamily enzyme
VIRRMRKLFLKQEVPPIKDCLLEFGDFTYGAEDIRIHSWNNHQRVRIGKYCSIASNVQVFLGGGHKTSATTTYPFAQAPTLDNPRGDREGHPVDTGDILIGHDVWIGMNTTIMGGVTIGNGAVIAANSHVVRDVLPYEIVGGNPAITIRNRFDQTTIEALEEIQWWDWSADKVFHFSDLLTDHLDNRNLELLIAASKYDHN